MPHAVTLIPPPIPLPGGAVVHCVPAAEDNLIWLIALPSGEAAVVDGPDAEAALQLCAAKGLHLSAVLNTHTHGDHVGVNRDLHRRGLLSAIRVIGPSGAASAVPGLTEAVSEGDARSLGGSFPLTVWLTEGHMNGHISFITPGAVFCGDTLFAGGCGYLFDGPPKKMFESLSRLAALPDDTLVFCAHEYTLDNLRFAIWVEPDNLDLRERLAETTRVRAEGRCTVPSTIGLERATNPFLRAHSPSLQARLREELPEAPLHDALAVFTAARALKNTARHRAH
ncbi:hydroxyacylglutathione hydrolase [Myxococcota bacterium]|nr:hydroxyacylglutathione hydrolase [Myxococcota bacterium]